MRSAFFPALLLVIVAAWSACSNGDPECQNSDCIHPPANECLDAQILREFDPQGTCSPESGECRYLYTDRSCQYGCTNDRCQSADSCTGVVCDQPPDNRCQDADTLLVFEAQGECVRPEGECVYDHTERTCADGCQDGQCTGVDPCEGVVCNDPPSARCPDPFTIEEFELEGTCDPGTGRCEYQGVLRNCPDGCHQGVCLDLGDDFALAIPPGTRVCSDNRSTWDVFGDYHTRMRISFRDGAVSLPSQAEPFERDWIESVEFGPDRVILTPLSNGSFTRTLETDRVDFQFVQLFTDGETTYELTYDARFDTSNPDDRVRVFDELYLTPPLGYPSINLDLIVDDGEYGRWEFTTCTFDLYLPVLHRVVTGDGALLELEERFLPSDGCMLACPTGLLLAKYQLGPDLREVRDPFRLSFVDSQHNWHDRFLVVFDEPVGDVHGLHFFPADYDVLEKKVDYLDSGLNITGQSLVVSHHTVELWFLFDSGTVAVDTCGEYCRDQAGLSEDCENSCILGGQALAGRCFPSLGWPPGNEWTPIDSCDTRFDACIAAGMPFIQCCCSRIASDW